MLTAPGSEYNISEAWLLSSTPLPTWQVNMADSCSMNFLFIRKKSVQSQDIWKDVWGIFKMTAVALGPKNEDVTCNLDFSQNWKTFYF